MRFNRRRVVVALDAQGHGQIPTDVDDARALARPHQHPRRFGGESAQVYAGRLVGTVFRPHHGVHGQLEVGRGPPESSSMAFNSSSVIPSRRCLGSTETEPIGGSERGRSMENLSSIPSPLLSICRGHCKMCATYRVRNARAVNSQEYPLGGQESDGVPEHLQPRRLRSSASGLRCPTSTSKRSLKAGNRAGVYGFISKLWKRTGLSGAGSAPRIRSPTGWRPSRTAARRRPPVPAAPHPGAPQPPERVGEPEGENRPDRTRKGVHPPRPRATGSARASPMPPGGPSGYPPTCSARPGSAEGPSS